MKYFIILAFLLFCGAAQAADFKVADKGEACSAIIVDLNAPRPVQLAARELQNYFKLLTTARIPILQRTLSSRWSRFVLGTLDSPLIKPILKSPHGKKNVERLRNTDGFAVEARGKVLYIYAANGRGVLNGVHRLIMRHTDFIWVRPHKEAAMYTVNPDLVLKVKSHIEIPVFRQRGWLANRNISMNSEEFEIFCSRLYNNTTTALSPRAEGRRFDHDFFCEFGGRTASGDIVAGHNISWLWLNRKKYGKTNPDFYMLVNGRRVTDAMAQPCFTNQNMTRTFTAEVMNALKTLPKHYKRINIMIDDTPQLCECKKCLAPIKLPDGRVLNSNHRAFRSTQYYLFLNQVAAAVYKKYPDLEIKSFGYFFTAEPPEIPLFKNIVVHFCPYIRNDKESILGKTNKLHLYRVSKYAKMSTAGVIWREYYYSMAGFPRPIANIAAVDLRHIRKLGVDMVASELSWADRPRYETRGCEEQDFFTMCAPEFWVLNHLFWNPYTNVNKLRERYITRVFREGAPGVSRFYKLIRESWLKDPAASTYNDDFRRSMGRYVVDKKLVEPCRAALKDALKSVRDPRARVHIQRLNDVFEKWLKLSIASKIDDVTVPQLSGREFPGFDFEKGKWQKAGKLPPLRLMGEADKLPAEATEVKLFHNGETLFIGFRCERKGDLICNPAGMPHDTWPRGDHCEFFITPTSREVYRHFVFDANGNQYDGAGADANWNPKDKWTVKVDKRKDEWRAVVMMPFSSAGLVIQQNNRVESLFYRAQPFGNKGKAIHSSWGGARVHSAQSFGQIVFRYQ